MKLVGHTQHVISGAPSDVAVKGDAERICDAAFELKLIKSLNALSRRLNLTQCIRNEETAGLQ